MEKAFLVPKAGLLVRDPITHRPLSEGGAEKPLSPYWRRRIKDGDVSRAEAKAKRAVKPEASKED